MEQQELNPCPHCGAVPVIERAGGRCVWVRCQACGASSKVTDKPEDTIAAWNRRAIMLPDAVCPAPGNPKGRISFSDEKEGANE